MPNFLTNRGIISFARITLLHGVKADLKGQISARVVHYSFPETPITVIIRGHLGDPIAHWRIILRRIFRKWDVGVWTGSSWLRIGTGGGHL
jgi:hypothetical protein